MNAKKDGAAIVGVGAVACAACCVGPILGFIGAIGLGTVAGVLAFGLAGLLIAAIGIAIFVTRRRRANRCGAAPEVTAVTVATPMIRSGTRSAKVASETLGFQWSVHLERGCDGCGSWARVESVVG